jgi:hypothetical protein
VFVSKQERNAALVVFIRYKVLIMLNESLGTVADGGNILQIRIVAARMLNKQSAAKELC